MEIKFTNVITNSTATELTVSPKEKGLSLKVQYIDQFNDSELKEIYHSLDLKQLTDFIGALLHLQSKLRK